MKIEKSYNYKGKKLVFKYEKLGVKIFTNDEDAECYITDVNGNVLFIINAECSQNYGYLEIHKNEY